MTGTAPDPANALASQRMRGKLRDMEANLDQFIPQIVQGDDGRRYLCMAGMLPHQASSEPYPYQTPQSRVPGLEDIDLSRVDFSNLAMIQRIEDRLNLFGNQAPTDGAGQSMTTRANPMGFSPNHDFQVVWSGTRRQWLVHAGSVSWLERPQSEPDTIINRSVAFPSKWLNKDSGDSAPNGCIALAMNFAPWWPASGNSSDSGYLLNPQGPFFITNPAPTPAILTWKTSGALGGDEEFVQTFTWSGGRYYAVLAYVEAPCAAHKAPLIEQFARGSISLTEANWPGARPHFFWF